MLRLRYSFASKIVALLLMASMYIFPSCSWAAKQATQSVGSKITVLVFPVDVTAKNAPTGLGKDLAETIKSSVSSIDGYLGLLFEERLPSVKRSIEEGSLKRTDVSGPFAVEKSAAGKIAQDVRANLYIVGEVEEIILDAKSKKAEITLSAKLVDTETGDILHTVVVTGRNPEGGAASNADLIALAAGNAVNLAVGDLFPGAFVEMGTEIKQPEPTSGKSAVQTIRQPLSSKKMTLVFPFDSNVPNAPPELGNQIATWLKSSLGLANDYLAVEFSERLPSIDRLRQEGTLKQSDLAGPFSQANSQALKIAREVESDQYIVGSIDECKVDVNKRQAEVALTVQVFDTVSGKNLKTLAVMGKTPVGTESSNDKALIALATGNAVSNAVAEIVPGTPMVTGTGTQFASETQKKKRSSTWKMILLGIAIAGGIAFASGSSNSGGGVDDDLPPPPDYP